MTAVGLEPTPLRNGALSHRLRPLGQTVLIEIADACICAATIHMELQWKPRACNPARTL